MRALVMLSIVVTPAMPLRAQQSVAPRTRTYYIAADEVAWDYDPGGRDEIGRASCRERV